MQISSGNYSINFGARNKDVRKADDIQRKVRQTFPMISNSYVDNFYTCTKENSKNYARASKIADNIWYNISAARDIADNYYYNYFPNMVPYYTNCLCYMSNSKKGNCAEYSIGALAGLYANGYYNSRMASLRYRCAFIDKKTGQVEYTKLNNNLDHTVVLTDMNSSKSRDIVIDPWLCFSAKKQEAAAKYKQVFNKKCENFDKMCLGLFKISKLEQNEKFNPEDYIMVGNVVYKVHPGDSIENIKSLNQLLQCSYDELILKK